MKITRKQLRKLIKEATNPYYDDDPIHPSYDDDDIDILPVRGHSKKFKEKAKTKEEKQDCNDIIKNAVRRYQSFGYDIASNRLPYLVRDDSIVLVVCAEHDPLVDFCKEMKAKGIQKDDRLHVLQRSNCMPEPTLGPFMWPDAEARIGKNLGYYIAFTCRSNEIPDFL